MPGIHFFIDKTLNKEIRNLFSFRGYPGYAFFDRNGIYRPGAIEWIGTIDRPSLAALIEK